MKNPLTTIGGLIGGLGTALTGFGSYELLSQFKEGYTMDPAQISMVKWVVLIGTLLSVVGKSVAGAAAADSQSVERTVDRKIDEKIVEATGSVPDPLKRDGKTGS